MSQSKLTESEVLQIRSMMESIDGKLDLLLGANSEVRAHVHGMFKNRRRLAEIYMRLDEKDEHNQTTTLEYLAKSFGTTKQNVGQILKPLREAGLISVIELPSGHTLLKKNSCDRVFSISRHLRKEFALDESQRRAAESNAQVSDAEPVSG